MSPVLVLAAAWMLVIGYGLVFIGYSNLKGTKVGFSDAFGLSKVISPSSSSSGGGTARAATGGGLLGSGGGFNTTGRTAGTQIV